MEILFSHETKLISHASDLGLICGRFNLYVICILHVHFKLSL